MNKASSLLFWVTIIAGFLAKIYSLFYLGIFDMDVYQEWGLNTLRNGLNESYVGVYFPFQYQIFEFGSWLSQLLQSDYYVAYKIVNLAFDCGNLIVLYFILKKLNISQFYLLIYWVHPWFLNMFSLGYIDFHFTFFILLMILFSFRNTSRDYLIAGIFLGFAFLMKPQSQIIIFSLFIYALIEYFKTKNIKLFHLFVFPFILFLNYTLYFWISGSHPLRLANVYVNISNHMPCLNANCTNLWFPVAYYLKEIEAPIYSISDEIKLLGIKVRFFAIALVLTSIYLFIKKLISQEDNLKPDIRVLILTCFASLAVPFLMTSAHENHIFLGTVLLIPVMALSGNILFKICAHVIFIIQFINLYGYYHLGEIPLTNLPSYSYTYSTALIFSFIAGIIYLIMLIFFFKNNSLIKNTLRTEKEKNENKKDTNSKPR